MENDIIFKKAGFGGFDREDVMNYIAKITDEFHARLSEKNADIAKSQERIDELTGKIGKFEKDYGELSEKCEQLEKRLEEILKEAEEAQRKSEEESEENETQTLKDAVKALSEKVDELLSTSERKDVGSDDRLGYDSDLFDLIDQYAN